MSALIVIIVVVLVLALLVALLFNGMVKKRNRTQEAWSEIDIELKRRHDLIPNLVQTVQGYATHEKGTFEAVTNARAAAVQAGATGDPAAIGPAENTLTSTLRSLFAVAENYPQLRAVESFIQLQETLTSTEDKIEYSRRYYNTSARDFNTAIQTFPRNLVGNMMGFKPFAFFAVDEADRAVPQVSFDQAPTSAPTSAPAADSGPPLAAPGDSGPPTAG